MFTYKVIFRLRAGMFSYAKSIRLFWFNTIDSILKITVSPKLYYHLSNEEKPLNCWVG